MIVPANDRLAVDFGFSKIYPQDNTPLNGRAILAAAGLQKEHPFSVRGAWQKDPINYPGIVRQTMTGGFTLLLVIVVLYLLHKIFFTKVSPFVSKKNMTLQVRNSDENKSLRTIFHNCLRELNEQGLTGNLVNPQPLDREIELPTHLGREGDILRAIIELLDWILPRRGQSIRLEAVEGQTNGKGLCASILSNKNNKVVAERVFWPRQYGLNAATQDVDYLLMTPVILWLSACLKQHPSDKKWETQAKCILENSLWGTDRALGKTLYLDVIRQDPYNSQAQLGLGCIFLEESNQYPLQPSGINLLKLAIADLKEVTPGKRKMQDPIWLAAKYNLAVAWLSIKEVMKAKQECDLLSKLVFRLPKGGENGSDPEFSQSFETMFLIFKHSIMLQHTPPAGQAELDEMITQALREVAERTNSKKEKFDMIVGSNAVVPGEEEKVIRVQVEGPIVLTAEPTESGSQ